MEKPIGLTKQRGFQVGARKTFPIPLEQAWEFLLSPEGGKFWLGEPEESKALEIGKTLISKEGIEAKISIYKPRSHLRMTWKHKAWKNTSILQIRVIPAGTKTTISFHQEKLSNEGQRALMKAHWKQVLAQITAYLEI